MKKNCLCIFFVFFLFQTTIAWPFEALSIRTIDGDTIVVLNLETKQEQKIRFYGVDTPERDQPFGSEATRFVQDILKQPGLKLQIDRKGQSYDRVVGIIHIDGYTLNGALVKAGLAWVSDKYCHDDVCSEWREFEREAREDKIGLWVDDHPVEPWVWREWHK